MTENLTRCECNDRDAIVDRPLLMIRYKCRNCGGVTGSIPINWDREDLDKPLRQILGEAEALADDGQYRRFFNS